MSRYGTPKVVPGSGPMLKRAEFITLRMILTSTYYRMRRAAEGGLTFGMDLPTMSIVTPHAANLYRLVKAEMAARANCEGERQYNASYGTPDLVVKGAVKVRKNQHATVYRFADQSAFIEYTNGRRAYRERSGYMMAQRMPERHIVNG